MNSVSASDKERLYHETEGGASRKKWFTLGFVAALTCGALVVGLGPPTFVVSNVR